MQGSQEKRKAMRLQISQNVQLHELPTIPGVAAEAVDSGPCSSRKNSEMGRPISGMAKTVRQQRVPFYASALLPLPEGAEHQQV